MCVCVCVCVYVCVCVCVCWVMIFGSICIFAFNFDEVFSGIKPSHWKDLSEILISFLQKASHHSQDHHSNTKRFPDYDENRLSRSQPILAVCFIKQVTQ